ncbi:MAG TPA: hypothetical protein VJL28_10765 [Gemmatimonadaceae bacterium]|nr:hypothetical protein [Gemmatimonadaceae bacterium]
MDRELMGWPRFRWASAGLAVAAALATWTLLRAVRVADVPDAAPPAFVAEGALALRSDVAPVNVRAAVERDLFAPDRSAPAQRYRLPGEDEPSDLAGEPATPVVLGTAIAGPGRSFATCQLGDDRPIIVRVGDKIGEYTVRTIERGRVVFTTANGSRLEVLALRPGS